MSAIPKARGHQITPLKKREDPAGADKVVMAAAQGGVRWVEGFLSRTFGVSVDLWNGPNGAGAVILEAVRDAGIPNKRFGEIVTPRAIAERAGLVPVPKRVKGRTRK